ncbi:hypothetical protein J6590_055634 [Homalodisca vitripennis]|nr:hypothetical protein J6590_055634 [Homalodisca vitripennis]
MVTTWSYTVLEQKPESPQGPGFESPEFPPLPSSSDDTIIPNSVILQPVEEEKQADLESYVSDTSSSDYNSQGHQFYTDPTMQECQVKCQKVNGLDMISLPHSYPVSVKKDCNSHKSNNLFLAN